MMQIEKLQLWDTVPEVDGVEAKDLPEFYYYPAVTKEKARGAVVVLPGGGYGGHANHEGHSIACWLNGQGIHAYVLKYRVSPHRHPAPLADTQRAMRIARARADECGYKEDKIGILGFSAGGHLCASAVTMYDRDVYEKTDEIDQLSAKPDAGILCYAVATFTDYTHKGSLNNLLGQEHEPEMRTKMSPEEHINAETPTCFIWSTSNDGAVPVQNSLLFAQKLADNNVQFEMHVYPDGPHGIGMHNLNVYDHCRDWAFACEKWLFKLGF